LKSLGLADFNSGIGGLCFGGFVNVEIWRWGKLRNLGLWTLIKDFLAKSLTRVHTAVGH
jgi:hypothetical protein